MTCLSFTRLSLSRFKKHLSVLSGCSQGKNWETNLRATWEVPAPQCRHSSACGILPTSSFHFSLFFSLSPSLFLQHHFLIIYSTYYYYYYDVHMHVEVRGWHVGDSSSSTMWFLTKLWLSDLEASVLIFNRPCADLSSSLESINAWDGNIIIKTSKLVISYALSK